MPPARGSGTALWNLRPGGYQVLSGAIGCYLVLSRRNRHALTRLAFYCGLTVVMRQPRIIPNSAANNSAARHWSVCCCSKPCEGHVEGSLRISVPDPHGWRNLCASEVSFTGSRAPSSWWG